MTYPCFPAKRASRARLGLAVSFFVATLLASGCPPQSVTNDAPGMDAAAVDAPRPDATSDALLCTVRCESTAERCCFAEDGTPACIDVSSDVTNCGLCGLDCVATNRGDRCIAMQCSCGDFSIGCTGDGNSTCCPPSADGRTERCANLGRDFGDCGECGRICDVMQANRCEGGSCRCGTDGALCDGTPRSLCCVDVFDVASCADTMTDGLNCGGCNRRCGAFETCMEGVCVDFTLRDSGPPPDAGPFDAGRPDAGPDASRLDVGPPDAGSMDSGIDDAGGSDAGLDAASPIAAG